MVGKIFETKIRKILTGIVRGHRVTLVSGICAVFVFGIMCLFIPVSASEPVDPSHIKYVETHIHLDAVTSRQPVTYEEAAISALASMDKLGIQMCLILPPPEGPDNRDRYTYKKLIPVIQKYPRRFAFLGGGGTLNYMIMEVKEKGSVSEATRRKFKATAEQIARDGACGFGEMTALHFSFNPKHPFESVSPDHELFLLLADIAAEYNIPIDIHMEAVVQDNMPFPYDEHSRRSSNNPKYLDANIPAFERLLNHNPKAKIIWVHIGWDHTGEMKVSLIRRLLKTHPNLYMSLKGHSHSIQENRALDSSGKLKPEWKKLVSDFPNRFLFGSDMFYGVPGKTKPFPDSTRESRAILNQLPPGIARKIAYENAVYVYNLTTLPDNMVSSRTYVTPDISEEDNFRQTPSQTNTTGYQDNTYTIPPKKPPRRLPPGGRRPLGGRRPPR